MNSSDSDVASNFTQDSDQDSDVNSALNLKLLLALYFIPMFINTILGLPSNVYVLWLIAKGGRESVTSDFFALNLSVEEVLFSALILVVTCMKMGEKILDGLLYTGRPLFQCCICVERYLAVVHPVVFLRYKHLRYKAASSALVWLVCFTSVCMVLFWPLTVYIAYGVLLLSFSVKIFCCLAVLKALRRPGPGEGDREREGTNNIKTRAFKIILLILCSMQINYVPLMLLFVFEFVLGKSTFILANLSFSLVVLTGFVQPLLYLHRSGRLLCQKA